VKVDELAFELKNVFGKLKSKEDNLNFTQKQLEEANLVNNKLQHNLKDYEKQSDNLRSEINNLNGNLQKERALRLESEKDNEHLHMVIKEKEREVGKYHNELDNSRGVNQRLSEDKVFLSNENDKLRNHIMLLTEQNQAVSYIILNIFI
jgi:chromosome segregation ATPase